MSSRGGDKIIARGAPLLKALAETKEPVRWLRRGDVPRVVAADMASAIVRGGHYEGKIRGDGRRVYFVREVDPRPEPVRDDSFWYEMPALRCFPSHSLRAAARASHSASVDVRRRLAELRRREHMEEIASIQSGRWLAEEDEDGGRKKRR